MLLSEKTQEFIRHCVGEMSLSLAEAIIEQFGGEAAFLANYKDVNRQGIETGFDGWINDEALINFYTANKSSLCALARNYVEWPSDDGLLKLITELRFIPPFMNVKNISAGMYNKDSEHRAAVAQAAAWFAASELARYYEQMIEDLESCVELELAE